MEHRFRGCRQAECVTGTYARTLFHFADRTVPRPKKVGLRFQFGRAVRWYRGELDEPGIKMRRLMRLARRLG